MLERASILLAGVNIAEVSFVGDACTEAKNCREDGANFWRNSLAALNSELFQEYSSLPLGAPRAYPSVALFPGIAECGRMRGLVGESRESNTSRVGSDGILPEEVVHRPRKPSTDCSIRKLFRDNAPKLKLRSSRRTASNSKPTYGPSPDPRGTVGATSHPGDLFGRSGEDLGKNQGDLGEMDSLERLMSGGSHHPALTAATRSQSAFVQANLCSVIGRKGRHLTGTFCLTGDTMEGIIQCLVFLKAFSVRARYFYWVSGAGPLG
ncbi:hypothetical protein KM043_013699 [Ampulex compressa]|nr:hypothetical protein KM043_013699 [Ampulex compressa]